MKYNTIIIIFCCVATVLAQFGRQLFSELDYVNEASNGERFKALYGSWENVRVPASCISLSRRQALVTEWVEGEKGPWLNTETGKDMIRIGLRCSVDQLLNTGFFHGKLFFV